MSPATIWEAGIKAALGRLEVGSANLVEEVDANGFEHLPITAEYAQMAAALPPHHSDPFDRMLVAQALLEDLVVVTRDPRLSPYDIALLQG